MSTTHEQLPLINEGFAFKKAGERITHSEWNAVVELLAKCYNALVLDTDTTANAILTALASKSEQGHTHDTTNITGLSTLLDTKVSTALTLAKTSGEFDGTGIESVVLENGNLIITLTTGETLNLGNLKGEKGDTGAAGQNGVSVTKTEINNKGELIITLSDNTVSNLGVVIGDKGDKGDDGKDGKDGADYILTDDDKSEIAAQVSGDCVSYSEAQALTDEQKETARNNIDAVDANLVVSSILDSSAHPRALKIPNVTALQEYIDEYTMQQCVRNDVQQEITEYSQEIVRSNIGAVSQTELADGLDKKVDASLVVSNIISDTGSGLIVLKNNIPNGDALAAFVREHGVSSAQTQSLSKPKKARARQNIDVDGGKWELLYTIEGDGETALWEYTQFADGSPLKLTAVSAVIIQNVAEAEKSYGHLYAYCDAKSTQFPAAIYSYFTTNSAPTKSGTQRAYGVVEQYRGQYRAYSVGMAAKSNEVMRYTPYMQGDRTTSDHPYIDHIKIHKQTGVFSTGNKIEVYGVRCYDEV